MDLAPPFRMRTPADAQALVAGLRDRVEPGIDVVLVFDDARHLVHAFPMEPGSSLPEAVAAAARGVAVGDALMIVSNRSGQVPADRPDDELAWEELAGTAAAHGVVLVDWWVIWGTKAFSLAEHAPSGAGYGPAAPECECCRREAAGTLDDPGGLPWHAELLLRVHTAITEHGFFIQAVMGTGRKPGWAYTIGFLELGHPEVIVFGLDAQSASGALHLLHREIVAGRRRPLGVEHAQRLGDGPDATCLLPVPASAWHDDACHFATAAAYYEALGWEPQRLEAVQLVWATPDGHFPWNRGCAPRFRRLQPVLDPEARRGA
jgi:hypothetical protein